MRVQTRIAVCQIATLYLAAFDIEIDQIMCHICLSLKFKLPLPYLKYTSNKLDILKILRNISFLKKFASFSSKFAFFIIFFLLISMFQIENKNCMSNIIAEKRKEIKAKQSFSTNFRINLMK